MQDNSLVRIIDLQRDRTRPVSTRKKMTTPKREEQTKDNRAGTVGEADDGRNDENDPGLDSERIQRDLDKYREEMAEDAPASGTREDRE
jgi:hypothetical protein